MLVYAAARGHPLVAPCLRLLDAVAAGLRATTTVEAIQEFAHVRARRHGRIDAAALALDYARLLAPLVTVDPEDLAAGLDLFTRHPELGAFDAVLAAATLRRPSTSLVSADRAFAAVAGLRLHDPAEPGFPASLGAA